MKRSSSIDMTLPAYLTFSDINLAPLDATALAELQALAAEAMGWQSLGQGAYLYHGAKDDPQAEDVIHVVGIPDIALAGFDVLLLA